jgi:hypothetical protein
MNKHAKKIFSIIMLGIFSCNTIITYKIHGMAGALPLIETVAEQVPRVLITTGACLAGLAMTLWNRHQEIQPAPAQVINPSIEKPHINAESIPATVSIVSDIQPQLEESLYTSSIGESTITLPGTATPPAIPQPAAEPISVAQPISIAVDISTAKIGGDIARAEEQQLAASIPCNEVKAISFPVAPSYTIERIDLPAGVAYSVDNGLLTLTIDWSGQQAATNALRYANSIFLQDVAKLQSNMLRFPKFCELVTQQLKQISWCFTHIASTDLIERLYARLSLHKLGIVDPLQENLCRTINDLDYMFFHYDGTLCRAALNSLAYASDAMIGYIDWTDKQIGTIIPRDRYITKYDYERIKNRCTSNIFSYLYRQFTHSVGRCCRMTQARTGSANEYNKALELCLQYSAAFKFKLAEALRDTYKSPLFNDIIQYYKGIQTKAAAQQIAQLFNAQGIISIAQADPLYKQFAQAIQSATPTQKRAINDNFLVRHHLVSKMQRLWNIAASAPQYINDALYAILGTDCSALSSLATLQKTVHSIITQAHAEQQQQLVNTFYLSNGVLKEFAQHSTVAQSLKIPSSILAPESADLRNELNELIASCIDKGQDIASINKDITSICLQLNGNTPPTPVLPKGSEQPSSESPEPESNSHTA